MDAYLGVFHVLFPEVHYITCEDVETVHEPWNNAKDCKIRSDFLLSILPDDAGRVILPLERPNRWVLILIDVTGMENIVRPVIGYAWSGQINVVQAYQPPHQHSG